MLGKSRQPVSLPVTCVVRELIWRRRRSTKGSGAGAGSAPSAILAGRSVCLHQSTHNRPRDNCIGATYASCHDGRPSSEIVNLAQTPNARRLRTRGSRHRLRTPPAVYWRVVSHAEWGEFWRAAATPYGAATAGFAALTAGALAYYNGERQRRHDAGNVAMQLSQARSLDDRRHAADRDERLRGRYTAAAEQVGHSEHPVQLAGIVSLTSLADIWGLDGAIADQQACIDLLCSVLRSADSKDPMRLAIVDALFRHLDSRSDPSWRDCSIKLRGAAFADTQFLQGIRLPGADLGSANFQRANLDAVMFDGANLAYANFSNARLAGARLIDANLRGAQFQDANLGKCRLDGAKLYQANFHGANLAGADLRKVNNIESIRNISQAKHLDKCEVTDSQRRFIDSITTRPITR